MSQPEVVPVAAVEPGGGFDVTYLTQEGVEQRVPLAGARCVRFDAGLPVRRFTARKGQRHLSGWWWSATTGRLVGFESWLERDHVMLLDFDPAVVGIASQPFWLSWPDRSVRPGGRARHAPDYWVRHADGSGVVVDCRPLERRRPADLVRFAATARACALAGWQYRLVAAPDRTLIANVRWLAGYRHPRHDLPEVAAMLAEAFAEPARLMDGADAVGDPIAVLPVLFHLLWAHRLAADLSRPLDPATVVTTAGATR